mmetsp:Transcript_83549/g.233168  ORF Transcript_83549/g.233168 Transcript_83549/m.233168 type:complete len:313 (+) Transcript_83549:51-989(+)
MCDASTWLTCLHPRRYTRAKANAAKEPSTTHKLEAAHQKGISTRRSFKRLSIFLRRGMLNIAPSTSTDKDEAAAAHRIDSATVFLSPYLAPTNEPRKQSPAPVVSRTVPSGVASLKAPILISPGNKPDSPSDSLALQSPPKYIEPKLPRVTRTSISALPAAANFSRNAATASRTSGFFGTSPLCVLTPAMKVSSLSLGATTVRKGRSASSSGASVPPTSMMTGFPSSRAIRATSTLTYSGTSRCSITATPSEIAARSRGPSDPLRSASAAGQRWLAPPRRTMPLSLSSYCRMYAVPVGQPGNSPHSDVSTRP